MGQRGPISEASKTNPGGGVPTLQPPKGLSVASKRVWEAATADLAHRGLLESVDSTLVEQLCLCLERLRDAQAEIKGRGVLVEGYRGVLCKNPATTIEKACLDTLIRLSGALYLTPNARARLGVPGREPELSLDDILNGRDEE